MVISKQTTVIILLAVLSLILLIQAHGTSEGPLAAMRIVQGQSPTAKAFVIILSKDGFNGTQSSKLVIMMSEGDRVQITFIMSDEYRKNTDPLNRHIIEITGYELRTEEINPTHPEAKLVFLADKTGTFTIRCGADTWDCPGHDKFQDGALIVKASGEITSITTTAQLAKTELDLEVKADCFPKCPVTLVAYLFDNEFKPIGGMPVGFYVNTTLGSMKIGSVYTNESGIALHSYSRDRGGTLEFTASFAGGGGYESSITHVIIQLHSVMEERGPPLLTGRNVVVGITVLVIFSVWGTYIFVLRLVHGIAREGRKKGG